MPHAVVTPVPETSELRMEESAPIDRKSASTPRPPEEGVLPWGYYVPWPGIRIYTFGREPIRERGQDV